MENNKDITGSKKGGGGSQFYESDNTLQSTATVRILEVLSEGPIVGLVGKDKGIYLNNVAVRNADGTVNYGGKVAWDQREGYPDQPWMEGFPSASAEISVATQITNAIPVSYTVSSADTDSLQVTIGLPDGLVLNDTSNSRLIGSEVELKIEHRLGAGTWYLVKQFKIIGKSASPYEEGHRVPRPAGTTGLWSVRVSRITADNQTSTLRNNTFLSRVTEIQEAKLTYPQTAYVGVAVDARTLNSSQVPVRSYLVDGLIIAVPSNYNPATRVYTGVWNGTFKYEWTDNPAWVVYDLLANPTYGLDIDEDLIDKYSFYDAAVYNDAIINDGEGGTGPRFTFNYQILARQDAARWIQDIAGVMNAKIVWMGGMATVIQDRPASVAKLLTTSNVVDGKFTYRSSTQQERITAVNVSWNDPSNHYQLNVLTVDQDYSTGNFKTALTAATTRYGYNIEDMAAIGCTNKGQAVRAGRWKLDTVLNQLESVSFKMFLNGYDLFPGDIVEVFDEYYAGSQQAGRLLAGSTTTSILLDRPVTVTSGTTIDILINGVIESRSVSQTSGSLTTLTVTSAFSSAPVEYSDFIITTTLEPRQFRIIKVALNDDATVSVDALQHDPNKYNRVENDLSIPAPIHSAVPDQKISAPTGLLFREVNVNEDNTIVRALNVSWQRPTTGIITHYIFKWQVSNGGWSTMETTSPNVELPQIVPGVYNVKVHAVGYSNVIGTETTGTYTVSVAGGSSSTLNAVTGLQDLNSATAEFTGQTLNAVWTNPASNATVLTATIRDFEVKVLTTADVLLRTEYIPAVPAGATQTYQYTFDKNLADGGPRRSFKISVRVRDANNNFSSANVVTFSNPAPAALSGIVVTPGIGYIQLSYALPADKDFGGVLIWRSTTSGFTPGSGNLVHDTLASSLLDTVDYGTTYYYKLAAYDSFGKSDTGAGLNVSAQQTAEATASEGIPEVSSLPDPSGYTGPKIVYNTTDGQLYSYIDGAWEPTIPPTSDVIDGSITIAKFAAGLEPVKVVGSIPSTKETEVIFFTGDDKLYRWNGTAYVASVPSTDISGQLTSAQIAALDAAKLTGSINAALIPDASIAAAKFAAGLKPVEVVATLPGTPHTEGRMVYLTTDDKLYRNTGSGWVSSVPATDITGQLTNSQLADIAAAKLTGQITTTQISDNAITSPKILAGEVTAGKLSANSVVAANIVAGEITSSKLYAGAVEADLIQANNLAANSITAGKIQAGAITTNAMSSNSIDGDRIFAGSLHGDKITGRTIAAEKLVALSITAGELASNSVTTAKILAGNIVTNHMAADSIDGDRIATNTLHADRIESNTITAGKIQAGAIGANEIAANAITANKMAIYDYQGIVPDGNFQGGSANLYLPATGISVLAVANAPTTNVLQILSNVSNGGVYLSEGFTDAKAGDTFLMRVKALRDVNTVTSNTLRMIIYCKLADGTTTTALTSWYINPTNAWASYEAVSSACPANTVGVRARIFRNTHSNTSAIWLTGIEVRKRGAAELIVDGTITATKIAAGTLTANELAANTITGGKIAASTITASNIAASTITAGQIAAGTITGTQIAAGTVTADKINSTNLDIKDASGNVIFSAGKNLDMRRLQTSVDFVPYLASDFNSSSSSGWLGTTMTLSYPNVNTMRITPTAADSNIYLPTNTISVPGGKYNKIRARIKRIGGSGWEGTLYYGTAGHGFTGGYYKTLDTAYKPAIGEWIVVEWDMEALTVGGTDWTNNTINSIRIDFGTTISDVFDIDWIAVGRHGPPYIENANISTYIASAAIDLAQIRTASITNLAALSAELGSVVVSTTGSMRSGQTSYHTGTGWWLGHVGGVPKFSIGNPAAQYMTWDGTNLKVNTTVANITPIGVQADISRDVYAFLLGASGTAGAYLYFYNDGTIRRKINAGSITTVGNWYNPTTTSIGSSYYINFSKVSQFQGTFTGTLNTWTLMSATQTISLTNATLWVEATTLINVKIATDSGGTNIVGTGQCFLTAAREA